MDAEVAVTTAFSDIAAKARELERESRRMRISHQTFTVLTILLGVSAPALVTITTSEKGIWWTVVAIVATALASAAATIRTVLRFSERYANSALTSIALLDAEAQVLAKKEDVLMTVRPEFKEQKLFEVSAWARKQMFEVMKSYVEKDVSALTTQRIEIAEAPKVEDKERRDPTRRLPEG
jgi:hypothetical protein